MAHLHCEIPDELKRELDIIAAKKGDDLKIIVNRIVNKFVRQEKKKEELNVQK